MACQPTGANACNNGVCGCTGSDMLCGSSCVNTNTSNTHCGGCNQPCNGQCTNGVCTTSTGTAGTSGSAGTTGSAGASGSRPAGGEAARDGRRTTS